MSVLLQDIRYGLRRAYKNPGVTMVAAFSIALAIGANTTVFSLINAFLLRPLPFAEPERLVAIHETQLKQGVDDASVSFPNFIDLKEQNKVLADVAAYEEHGYNLAVGSDPERVSGAAVTTNLFSQLGIKPRLGRDFLPEEGKLGADHSVILSDRLWKNRFNSDPGLIGKMLVLNGETYNVVGVMPPRFRFPEISGLWTPLATSGKLIDRGQRTLSVVGRLKLGVTIEQAQQLLGTVAKRLQQQYPESNNDWGLRLVPLHKEFVGEVEALLYIFLGAVLFMLLIACANVSNIFLAQGVARSKEIAIRIALGAGRMYIVRQLLTESILVALIGGVFGVLLAYWGLNLLVAAIPIELPYWVYFDINLPVLVFTFIIALLAGMVFGLVPSLRASNPDLHTLLKESSRGATESFRRNRLRSMLVVSEVALTLILLIGAMLMVCSFLQLQRANPGFETKNVLTMDLAPSGPGYGDEQQRRIYFQRVIEQIQTVSGVQAVSLVNNLPINGNASSMSLSPEGQATASGAALVASSYVVSPDYFRALSIPVMKGRSFTEQDTATAPLVAIINETAAKRLWPQTEAVDQRLRVGKTAQNISWMTVVGVVKDIKQDLRDNRTHSQIYLPYTQRDPQQMTLLVRTMSEPSAFTAVIRDKIAAVDSGQPVFSSMTLERLFLFSVWQPRIYGLIFSVFAASATALAVVGIYGVIAYSVRQRTHEIGIRMALGAQRGQILKLILGQGMFLVAIGITFGLISAFAITRVLSGFLYGVTATDPFTFASTTLLLLAVALIANMVPALRATRVDPMIALREN